MRSRLGVVECLLCVLMAAALGDEQESTWILNGAHAQITSHGHISQLLDRRGKRA